MVRINLLPHREARRKERKQAFIAMMIAALIFGVVIVLAVSGIIASEVSAQKQRNDFIMAENARLDAQIKEIATLKQEIEGLKARQQAVEDLQSDRNQPVYLMDELVKQTPEGVYLKSFKQTGQRVVLNGFAQSNERVSELLRNLGNSSPWLERPDLVEIRSANVGQGRDARKAFEFTINVGIKRLRDKEAAAANKPAVAGVAGALAATPASAPAAAPKAEK
jgi:type IV pilus assembly protein PilN